MSLHLPPRRFCHSLCRGLILVSVLFTPLTRYAVAGEDYSDRTVIGRWKFVAVLDRADISGLGGREAQRLIGKILTVSDDKIAFGKRICPPSDFSAERVIPELYLREKAHASATNLRLPNPVTVVDLNCADAFIRNENQLVFSWNGVFFEAVRVKP